MWIKAQDGRIYNATYFKMIQVGKMDETWRVEADVEGNAYSYVVLATYDNEEKASQKLEELFTLLNSKVTPNEWPKWEWD